MGDFESWKQQYKEDALRGLYDLERRVARNYSALTGGKVTDPYIAGSLLQECVTEHLEEKARAAARQLNDASTVDSDDIFDACKALAAPLGGRDV